MTDNCWLYDYFCLLNTAPGKFIWTFFRSNKQSCNSHFTRNCCDLCVFSLHSVFSMTPIGGMMPLGPGMPLMMPPGPGTPLMMPWMPPGKGCQVKTHLYKTAEIHYSFKRHSSSLSADSSLNISPLHFTLGDIVVFQLKFITWFD